MSFKLLVVFAMISLAAAISKDPDILLYERKISLESRFVTKDVLVKPDTVRNIVIELVDKIYPQRTETEYLDIRIKNYVTAVYKYVFLDKKTCKDIKNYNLAIDKLINKVSDMPNVGRMLLEYKKEQNKMCK